MRFNFSCQFITFTLLTTRLVWAHSFILAIEGGNGVRSTAFGARLTSRGTLVQNTGIILQKEITAGQTTPCGRIFGGIGLTPSVVDVAQEMAIAERSGVASARQDGSVLMSLYAHNADGGGPYTCDYSSDTSLKELKPMTISKQIEGDKGNNPAAKDFAYPLISVFPNDAVCRGGAGGDTCIMRCINPLGFGSCAAIKLFGGNDSAQEGQSPPQRFAQRSIKHRRARN